MKRDERFNGEGQVRVFW